MDISVYLSSTDFHEECDDINDVMWKSKIHDNIISLVDHDKYNVTCHDPLQNISDKAEIVIDDINHIIFSDFVICYLPATKLTIGTLMELQYSCLNKPKTCIIVIDRYKIHRNHPWIKFWISNVVDNEEEAVRKMVNILGKGDFNNSKERF